MAEQTKQTGSVLDLSTVAPERAHIRIDGQIYFLADKSDLGVADTLKVQRAIEGFERLNSSLADITDDEIDVAAVRAREAAAIVLRHVDIVYEERPCDPDNPKSGVEYVISDQACIQIMQAFNTVAGGGRKVRRAASRKASSVKSSRASKDSTVATRSGG